jgi:flagellar basal body L-ring protein FlgH
VKTALIAALLALAAAGCGESPQTSRYKDGSYAGKPDTPAWQHKQFNDSRADWQQVIKIRNLKQSEYTRMKGSG